MTDLDARTPALAPAAPPPGWYPDAFGDTRWWDGAAWTGHVQPASAPAPAPAVAEAAPTAAVEAVVPAVPVPVPVVPVLPEGPAEEVYANSFEAVVAARAVSAAAEAASAVAEPEPVPVGPGAHTSPAAPALPSGHVTPSRAADLEGPSRGGSVVLLAVSVPLALWGAWSLLAVVLRGTDALGVVRTPLALLCLIVGGWVAAQSVVALRRGERAELPDAVVDAAETVADADRRVLGLVGIAVVVVVASYLIGPLTDDPPPPASPVAAAAVAAPKGFTPVAGEVAYRMLPATSKDCPKGSTCRTVEVVALVPCADVSAVIVFRDRFGGGLGTALVATDAPRVGKPVALTAQVRDPGATQVSVASIRCRDVA